MLTAILLMVAAPDALHARIARNDSMLVAAVSRPVSDYAKGLTPAQIDSGAARYLRDNRIRQE